MEIFLHHIYEYKKGLRRMVLHTAHASDRVAIETKLESQNISYLIESVNSTKINVFFGDKYCVDIIRSFGISDLSQLSDEQDFILGTLLGYDLVLQCKRYLKRKGNSGCHSFPQKNGMRLLFTGTCDYAN